MVTDSLITDSPDEFLARFPELEVSDGPTTMRAAMLVTPVGFEVAEESATDNVYMTPGTTVDPERATAQHADVARKLVELGVPVLTLPGQHGAPDGVYPNNVFAFARGKLILGAMKHAVRQREARREDIRELFCGSFGYELRDLSGVACLAELTGSLIIDHARNLGFCGLSSRTDAAGAAAMHEAFGLDVSFRFDLVAAEYHTNIVLSLLAGRGCVIFPPSFADPAAARAIEEAYGDGAIVLSKQEKEGLAGNCLAVTSRDVLMSARASDSLRDSTRARFAALDFRIHSVNIDELEKGGGSLRCLIAEIF